MEEAGLSLRTARPQHYEADLKRKPSFRRQSKKRPELTEKTVVVVDQFTKHVGTVQRRGFYPIGSNPTIEVALVGSSTVLGAVARHQRRLLSRVDRTSTSDTLGGVKTVGDSAGHTGPGAYRRDESVVDTGGDRENETVGTVDLVRA
ncbi:hypothetical protein C8039_08405 [Halogeometricum sp. wsp3]|nr:hypothetical protein C8039_08405 [Halogeometricum sp. wsp3]